MNEAYCTGDNECWKIPEDLEEKIAIAFTVSTAWLIDYSIVSYIANYIPMLCSHIAIIYS